MAYEDYIILKCRTYKLQPILDMIQFNKFIDLYLEWFAFLEIITTSSNELTKYNILFYDNVIKI